MNLKNLVLSFAFLIAAGASAANADTLIISTTLSSVSNTGVSIGAFTVSSNGNTGIFSALANSTGTAQNLQFLSSTPLNTPFLLSNFVAFQANPNLRFDATFIFLGTGSQSGCTASPAVGQTCTPTSVSLVSPQNPAGLTPYTFTNALTTSSLSFSMRVNLLNGGVTTPYLVTFTTQFTSPYQTILQGLNSGVPTPLSATFSPDPAAVATPEPTALVLLGTGLTGIGASLRRRFKQNP